MTFQQGIRINRRHLLAGLSAGAALGIGSATMFGSSAFAQTPYRPIARAPRRTSPA